MIIDVPTPQDFERTGLSLLNLAWDAVSSLHIHTQNSDLEQWDEEGSVTDEFWAAAQQPLGNAQALLQQGIEFLLKARIAEISPFLLIDRTVRDWPRDSTTRDVRFAEFRTTDAQDLVRIFNTVRHPRLDDAFAQRVEEQRKMRNTFVHSIDKSLRYSPDEIWIMILEVAHHLVAPLKWIHTRREYLEGTPASVAFSTDQVPIELASDVQRLLKVLKPAQKSAFLGVAPKARFYVCPHCAWECRDGDIQPTTAQLQPNTPESTKVFCFVCNETHIVSRASCAAPDCKGNVIWEDEGTCLVCYQDQHHFAEGEE